jgi:hypothetical protein
VTEFFCCCLQVEVRDVVEAFRLLEVAMQQSATDHATGQINLPGFVLHAEFSLATFISSADGTFDG